MGKSKKSKSGQPSRFRVQQAAPAQAFDPKKSRARALQTADDAFGGDEDEFHKNRDSILFEDDGAGDRDVNDLSSDDEIYGLNLPSAGSDDEESQAGEDDEEADEEEYPSEDEDETYSTLPADEPRGRFAKVSNPSQDVLSDASDAEEEEEEEAANSSDEEETWAAGSYHASRRAPGEADSSDDEALDLEAEEARRLQKKAKGVLAGEDYGFGEEDEEGEEMVEEVRKKARGKGRLEDEVLGGEGEKGEAKQWTEEEAIAHLLKKSPETLALLDDFTATAERIKGVEKNLEIVRLGDEDGKEHPALAIMELEHQALATYLPTLAFYFSLLLSPSPSSDLLSKVLARLSSLRQALATMEELDLTSAQYEESEGSSDEAEDDEEGMLASEMWDAGGAEGSNEESQELDEEDMRMLMEMEHRESDDEEEFDSEDEDEEGGEDSMLAGMTDEELEELMASMPADADADMFIKAVEQAQRQKAGLPVDDDEEDGDDDLPPSAFDDEMDDYEMNDIGANSKKNQKKKAKKASKKEIIIPDLPSSSSRKIASLPTSSSNVNDDYLDPTALSLTDSSDKASARHSLRFHVSQVKQKAAKREAGHGRRIGGDDDLPRRSKENARREVLKRQEHGALGDGKGEALDGGDWNEEDKRVARGVKGISGAEEEISAEDYYEAVKAGREEGRAAKKAKYDEERLEDRAYNHDLSTSLPDGPRGASRQIMANKGLQPKRAKVNRNPRVKKRMAYDKAVKKVATMKSVYKGGDRSGYEGEKSGIGKRVVKSVRLGGA
ncbi:hypothetical protein BCR35DRAFT_307014 [Leucosporidium creatinivorum]|uniref:Sas10 C-terminal domain-containing protein n=1 Tax=Leucosporidium creatinivorum TaxID=106004 RepID=A0A1Y2EQX9_9BASI|nr:hypothetical protein BCR35DRAFT_307014 [Leucosporidium creatinivorum]